MSDCDCGCGGNPINPKSLQAACKLNISGLDNNTISMPLTYKWLYVYDCLSPSGNYTLPCEWCEQVRIFNKNTGKVVSSQNNDFTKDCNTSDYIHGSCDTNTSGSPDVFMASVDLLLGKCDQAINKIGHIDYTF